VKKRAIREMQETLSDIYTELASLNKMRGDLAILARTEARRTQFAAEVEAIQRDRLPDSAELQLARNIANRAGGILRTLEWSGKVAGTRGSCCPICHAAKGGDHRPDCALFAVIGPPRLADMEI
jgi:hypothetical protein